MLDHLAVAMMVIAIAVPAASAGPPASAAAYAGIDETTLGRLRRDFDRAVESLDSTRELTTFLDSRFGGDSQDWPPVARAYRASLEGLLGKYEWRLIPKLERVNAAIAMFEGLVENHPQSLELRFMRYSLFSRLPAVFGVSRFVKPDLEALRRLLEAGADPMVPEAQRLAMIAFVESRHP